MNGLGFGVGLLVWIVTLIVWMCLVDIEIRKLARHVKALELRVKMLEGERGRE